MNTIADQPEHPTPDVVLPAKVTNRLRWVFLSASAFVLVVSFVGAVLLAQTPWLRAESEPSEALPGSIALDSEPSGAVVWLDGEEVGATPLSVSNVAAGAHRVVLSAPDYADWSSEIRVPPGGVVDQVAALDPLPARLVVSTQIDQAAVSIDGKLRGVVGGDVVVEPGTHVVRVEATGHRPWQRLVQLAPNERRSLNVELPRQWPDLARGDSISPLAVVIENAEDARPQAGLDRADVVYEVLAEGGITRFLAIYATQGADVVGPVRSARDYLVEWAHEYSAPLVHIGASPQGYAALATTGLANLDEIRGQPGFWRSAARAAPHNAYTSISGARNALGAKARGNGTFSAFQFKEGAKRSGVPATEATIKFGHWEYSASWAYDPISNEYLRQMDETPHLDAETGEQLRASNVLLQWTESWLIPRDTEGRLQFAQVGGGRLVALVDGVAIEGHWQKDSYEAPTRYFAADGAVLTLNPGTTWIEVIPLTGDATF